MFEFWLFVCKGLTLLVSIVLGIVYLKSYSERSQSRQKRTRFDSQDIDDGGALKGLKLSH